MYKSFGWRHMLALSAIICLLSIAVGAISAQDEPTLPDPVVPAFDLSGTTDQEPVEPDLPAPDVPTFDLSNTAPEVNAPSGITVTGLAPDGVLTTVDAPNYAWSADLPDTELLFFNLYQGTFTEDGQIVPTINLVNDFAIFPLTPTCTITGNQVDCELTSEALGNPTVYEDGQVYYWTVTSEAVNDVFLNTPELNTILTIDYNTAVQANTGPLGSGNYFFKFFANAGDQVTIAGDSPDFDVFLTVYDQNFGFVVSDDDSGGGTNALISNLFFTQPGLFYIEVSNSGWPGTYGQFTLALNNQDTLASADLLQLLPFDPATKGTLAYNDELTSVLLPGQHVYQFTGNIGDNVTITLDSFNFGFTPNLTLLDPNFAPLANDSAFFGAFINFTLTSNGTHYIDVSAGSSQLNLEDDAGLFTLVLESATTLANPNNVRLELPASEPIAYNQSIVAGLPVNPLFSFTGTNGDDVEIRMSSPAGSEADEISLLDANFAVLNSGFGFLNATLPADGTYYISVYDDSVGDGYGRFAPGTFILSLDNQNTGDETDNERHFVGLDTTIAEAGFVIDVPRVYPNNEDVHSTTPIFTWPEVPGAEVYVIAVVDLNAFTVPWLSYGATDEQTISGVLFEDICENGQCRIRPDQELTIGPGDVNLQFYVAAFGPPPAFDTLFNEPTDIFGYRLMGDFTIVAPLVTAYSDTAEYPNPPVPEPGRPYFVVRPQGDDGESVEAYVPLEVESMYGELREFVPDYYRVLILNEATFELVSDQWYQGTTALDVYNGLQDTLDNGNYLFFVQGYDTLNDSYTPFSAQDGFTIAEDVPDVNDLALLGIYETIGEDESSPTVNPFKPDPQDLTSTWIPCTGTEKPECQTSHPYFHFAVDADDYSGDWLGVQILDDLTGEVVAFSFFNRYTGMKIDGDLLGNTIYEPGDIGYYDESYWYCAEGFAQDSELPDTGFPDETCVFQMRSLFALLLNGFDYTVQLGSYGVGGFSGWTNPGSERTDPFNLATFSIAPEQAVTGLGATAIGAPLTSTKANFPRYLTETLLTGEVKVFWNHVPDALYYNVVISDTGGVVYDEWWPVYYELDSGALTGPDLPQSPSTVYGLVCTPPSDTPFTGPAPQTDLNFFTGSDALSGVFLPPNESKEFTFFGNRGQQVEISAALGFDMDPFVELLDTNGSVIASDDNGGGGADALIANQTLGGTGVYTIRVSNIGTEAGEFDLFIQSLNAITVPFASFGIGLDASGGANDSQTFVFEGSAGDIVNVYMFSGDANFDPFVQILDSANGVVGQDNNSGNGVSVLIGTGDADDAFIGFLELPADGVYQLVLNNNGTAAGFADVQVDVTPVDLSYTGTNSMDGGFADLTAPVTTLPSQEFTFAGRTGDEIRIEVNVTFGGMDPVAQLIAPNGSVIATNDNGNARPGDPSTDKDALLLVTLPQDGRYRIRVQNQAVQGGNYTVILKALSFVTDVYDGICGFTPGSEGAYLGDNGNYEVSVRYYNGGLSAFAEAPLVIDNPPAQAPEIADTMNVYQNENLTGTTRPIFQWEHSQGNQWYNVIVTGPSFFAAGDVEHELGWVRAADICNYEYLNVGANPLDMSDNVYNIRCDYAVDNLDLFLPAGDYTWVVQAYSLNGDLDETSTPASFSMANTDIGAPAPIFPPASTNPANVPVLTWTNRPPMWFTPGENAAWYLVYIGPSDDLGDTVVYDFVYSPLDNTDAGGTFPSTGYFSGNEDWDDYGWPGYLADVNFLDLEQFTNVYDNVCYNVEPFVFDPNVDLEYYGPLGLPNSLTTGLIPAGGNDLFTFNGTAGHQITIQAFSFNDVSLDLLGPGGGVVASDNDSGFGTNPQIVDFVIPQPGVYSIQVNNLGGTDETAFVQITNVNTFDIPVDDTPFQIYTGPTTEGNWTFITPSAGDVVCNLAQAEFTENRTYQWWMLPFGPAGVLDNAFGGWHLMGDFTIDVPEPEPVFQRFDPVYGALAAGGRDVYTLNYNSSDWLEIAVNVDGFDPSALEVFAPGDVPGVDQPLYRDTGGSLLYLYAQFIERGVYTIVIYNNDALDAGTYSMTINDYKNVYAYDAEGNFLTNLDGVVDGKVALIDWPAAYGGQNYGHYDGLNYAAEALFYYVEITDTATGDVVFSQWTTPEIAAQPGRYAMEIPPGLLSPYGVYEITIGAWGQGSDISEGEPFYGAVFPEDDPNTSINEGRPLRFTKL